MQLANLTSLELCGTEKWFVSRQICHWFYATTEYSVTQKYDTIFSYSLESMSIHVKLYNNNSSVRQGSAVQGIHSFENKKCLLLKKHSLITMINSSQWYKVKHHKTHIRPWYIHVFVKKHIFSKHTMHGSFIYV